MTTKGSSGQVVASPRLLFNPHTASPVFLRDFGGAAPTLAAELSATPVRDEAEIEAAASAFAREPGGGLIAAPDPFITTHRALVLALTKRYRIPVIYGWEYIARESGLISYGPDTLDIVRRSASYVDRVLRGERPGELPVQAPTKYELLINLKTAKTLGPHGASDTACARRRGDRMKRRECIVGLAAAAWPLAAKAQQRAVPIVGFLGSETPDDSAERLRAFHQGLSETGFVEGRNVAIEYRWAEGRNDRLPALAAELVRRQVAVIASVAGIPGAQAAKAATTTIPIVFFTGADPVAFGLVASFSRPGGNLTGASALLDEVGPKRLELMKELLPGATSMALVVNPANPVADTQSTDMLAAARTIGVTLHILHSSSRSDLDALLAPAAELGVRAFVIGFEQAFSKPTWQSAFAALAAQHKIPAVSSNPGFVTAGGLMSYGNNSSEAHYICGVYTGRILKGAKPRAQESRTAPRDQAPLRPSCLWLTRPWWTAALVNPLLVAA